MDDGRSCGGQGVKTGNKGVVFGRSKGTRVGVPMAEELESTASIEGWSEFLCTCVQEIFLGSLGDMSLLS